MLVPSVCDGPGDSRSLVARRAHAHVRRIVVRRNDMACIARLHGCSRMGRCPRDPGTIVARLAITTRAMVLGRVVAFTARQCRRVLEDEASTGLVASGAVCAEAGGGPMLWRVACRATHRAHVMTVAADHALVVDDVGGAVANVCRSLGRQGVPRIHPSFLQSSHRDHMARVCVALCAAMSGVQGVLKSSSGWHR